MVAKIGREAETERPGARLVLIVSILGSSLGFIDSSVVNIAIPTLMQKLEASIPLVQWVSNGYLLTLSSLVLLGGAIGDRYGTLRAFTIGLCIFVAASIACALSPTIMWLIAARIVQGIGAALLMPTSLALISQAFPGESRGKAIGTWAAAGGALFALGPPLGGWLVDMVGWRSIFFINVPIAGFALLLSSFIDVAAETGEANPLDVKGSIQATAFLALLTFGLVRLGSGGGVSAYGALAAAIPVMTWFLRVERAAPNPMMPLALFKARAFSGANALTLLLYGALSAALFVLPFSLVRTNGFTATSAGLAFLPFSLILGIGSRFTGGIADRVGKRLPLIVGPLVVCLGFAVLACCSHLAGYWSAYLPGLLLVGAGMTIAVPALTTVVFESAPAERSGAASGINNAAARGGGLLATAAVGVAFGGADMSNLPTEAVAAAYVVVMWAASIASALSALIAFATIGTKPGTRT